MAVLNDLIVQGSTRLVGDAIGTKFIVANGTASQFLKADGSLDSTSYSSATQVNTALSNKQDKATSGTAAQLSAGTDTTQRVWTAANLKSGGDAIWQAKGSYLTGVTLTAGTNNGTLKLTVNGTPTDNIAVKGLGTMAYQNTGSYSSATQVNTALSNKVDKTEYATFSAATNTLVGRGFTSSSITDVIIENEEITSKALTDLDGRKLDASAYTPSVELWVSGSGENTVVQNGGENTASGKLSLAEGSGTTASGNYSHAEGQGTTASGYYSHAEGYGTTASSYYSHAEGYITTANGNCSHAEGYSTTASGQSSHAEGYNTTASSNYSHAEGQGTTASNVYSHAEGQSTTANGQSSHAEGQSTKANGNCSHAEGNNTIASGASSHAEGYNTTANGNCSHAEGNNTIASGASSHAEGQGTTASNYYSHAEGYNTTASSNYSHAEGQGTTANGQSSHAEGYNTTASGYYSHAEGYGTQTNKQSEHASGQFNVSSSASTTFGNSGNTLFSVGNGTSIVAKHNAFEIRQNGDIYISSGGTNTSPMIKLQDNFDTINASIEDLSGQSETVAAALNYLNGEIDNINNTIGDIETLLAAI